MIDLTDAIIFLAMGACVALVVWVGRMLIRFLKGPAPVPQEAQAFPYPIIVHMSMGQRLDAKQAAETQAQWELWKEIEELTR